MTACSNHWDAYEYDADLDAAAARMKAAKQSGATGDHTDLVRPSMANPKPSEDELRAQQWAHLRRFYVKGEQ